MQNSESIHVIVQGGVVDGHVATLGGRVEVNPELIQHLCENFVNPKYPWMFSKQNIFLIGFWGPELNMKESDSSKTKRFSFEAYQWPCFEVLNSCLINYSRLCF